MAEKNNKIEETNTALMINDNESSTAKQEEEKKPVEPAKADNPKLGVFFYILSGVSFALNFIFAKVIYENKP